MLGLFDALMLLHEHQGPELDRREIVSLFIVPVMFAVGVRLAARWAVCWHRKGFLTDRSGEVAGGLIGTKRIANRARGVPNPGPGRGRDCYRKCIFCNLPSGVVQVGRTACSLLTAGDIQNIGGALWGVPALRRLRRCVVAGNACDHAIDWRQPCGATGAGRCIVAVVALQCRAFAVAAIVQRCNERPPSVRHSRRVAVYKTCKRNATVGPGTSARVSFSTFDGELSPPPPEI